MKIVLLITIFLITISCTSQEQKATVQLSVSPAVKQTKENSTIISTLKLFLETKNSDPAKNIYWKQSDFNEFVYPYAAIASIEKSKFGPDYYQPSLMEIIKTDDPLKKIVKIAYIGYNYETNENLIQCIYNVIANVEGDKIVFSSYTGYAALSWKKLTRESITYYVSPSRSFSNTDAEKQQKDIEKLCAFFNSQPIPIRYFSCTNPIEVFNLKGFDYNTMMYASSTGGLAEEGNIIYSGNNSEYYTHEIVHIYTHSICPYIPKIIDEGLATYLGGSGKFDYKWHKNELKKHIQNNKPDYTYLVENPFERLYINDETPIPYLIGALICEKGITDLGSVGFLKILREHPENANTWDLLAKLGITRENIEFELHKILDRK